MPSSRPSSPGFFRRFFGRLWAVIDGTRRLVLNLVFLALVAFVVVAMLPGGATPMDPQTTLVVNLRGRLVEQQASTPRQAALAQVGGGSVEANTQLRDVRAVFDAAAADADVHEVLLVLDEFRGAGLPALREAAAAIARFRASGKKVTAWASGYDQRQYYLAAQADELLMHPMGAVLVQGYGGYRNYYREALDKVGVTVHLLRVGQFKDAGEAFIANGPSPESQEASRVLYEGLWDTYRQDMERARKLPEGTLPAWIDDLPQRLAAAGGDPAKAALDAKLVDRLVTLDALREALIARGAPSDDGKSFRQIGFDAYLARQVKAPVGDAVAVVVAEGGIVDGTAPAGSIGGYSTAELVRKARLDDAIKAVVLRVNSPGGSPYGSELIRRELELTRAAGKPVVVSMGDVAASGGYWISLAADEVVADAATVTGSIGVFALVPSADRALEQLGVHTDGVRTSWLVGAGDVRRPLDPRYAEVLQMSIGHVYRQFTTLAATARKTTPEKIDAVGQGRVWTGSQALERGLVDTLGGFDVALQSAARRAKLEGTPRVRYVEPERSRFDRLLQLAGGAVARVAGDEMAARLPWAQPPAAVLQARDEMAWLLRLTERGPHDVALAHCLCAP